MEEHPPRQPRGADGELDLIGAVRKALDASRTRVAGRFEKLIARHPPKAAVRLSFVVSWGARHEASVFCAPQSAAGESISHGMPYGSLLTLEPPPGHDENPRAFAEEKPAAAESILRELASWWQAAGGTGYPLPAAGLVHGEPLRLFDFAAGEWKTDEAAVRRQELAEEFTALARARLARFRPLVVERVRKTAAKLGPGEWEFGVEVFFDDDFEVMFGVTDGAKRKSGRLFPPYSELVGLLRHDTFHEDRERYAELGVDTQQVYHRELEQFVADVWADVAGPDRVTRGRLQYHDDGAEYDLVARRWATDFLGRPLV